MTPRETSLRIARAVGGVIGYGCFGAFLVLLTYQVYRWFKDGDWTHIGLTDGLRAALDSSGGLAATGRLSDLSHWLDAPVDWLGLHKLLEVLPTSLVLFAISILGNAVYLYASDRLRVEGR